jgi:hypothetical protein
VVEVHAVDRGDEGGRQEQHRQHREDLDDVILLDVDEAEGGIEQDVDVVGEEGGAVGERGEVAAEGVGDGCGLRGEAGAAGRPLPEQHEPLQPGDALADVGDELAVAADGSEHMPQPVVPAAVRHRRAEHRLRDAVDLPFGEFEGVGEPVDHGIEQAGEHPFGGRRGQRFLLRAAAEHLEGARFDPAQGDEPAAVQQEGDGIGDRLRALGAGEQRGVMTSPPSSR